jgi:hypothetical protein
VHALFFSIVFGMLTVEIRRGLLLLLLLLKEILLHDYQQLWKKMFGLKRAALSQIIAKADVCLSTCIGAWSFDLEVGRHRTPRFRMPAILIFSSFLMVHSGSSRCSIFPLSSSMKRPNVARWVYSRVLESENDGSTDTCDGVADSAYSAHERL